MGKLELDTDFLKFDWYNDPNTLRLYIHLNLRASESDETFRGIEVSYGFFVTSISRLSGELSISHDLLIKSINKLIKAGEIYIDKHRCNFETGDELLVTNSVHETLLINVVNQTHGSDAYEYDLRMGNLLKDIF